MKIYAASKEQMEAFIAAQSVEVLKAAYTEMPDGSLTHPDQWEWYAIWMIELKDGTHIVALIEEIRDSEYYIPELSFVAELNGEIVGHFHLKRCVMP